MLDQGCRKEEAGVVICGNEEGWGNSLIWPVNLGVEGE